MSDQGVQYAILALTIITTICAILTVPSLQALLGRISPAFGRLVDSIGRQSIAFLAVLIVISVGVYFYEDRECSERRVETLKAAATGYIVLGQWSFVGDLGKKFATAVTSQSDGICRRRTNTTRGTIESLPISGSALSGAITVLEVIRQIWLMP
jgi:hypothetical protein